MAMRAPEEKFALAARMAPDGRRGGAARQWVNRLWYRSVVDQAQHAGKLIRDLIDQLEPAVRPARS